MSRRILVTGATGKIGGAVAAQLLEHGVTTRAMVHRDDARSARLREMGAEVVIADMFDIQQVTSAMAGVDRHDGRSRAATSPVPKPVVPQSISCVRSPNFMLTALTPMHRLDTFDRTQQHPRPAHLRLSGQSPIWRSEHAVAQRNSVALITAGGRTGTR
ncbi:NAD(P)H-binding protein [Mycobacterium sp. FLAC0960]|uniref:NmrA-like domain-containing protein n=1 Tax=Mycobacterium colombiense TaxID=339268 RepID=A0A329LFR6_9MYCO|nr:hypothetical protein DQP57_25600 [Mycobacterium colombiense]